MGKIKNLIKYYRFELIYLLGGVPKEHINTLNYKNINSVVNQIQKSINSFKD